MKQIISGRRSVIPRQERFDNDKGSLVAHLGGRILKIVNYSRFGLGLIDDKNAPEASGTVTLQVQCVGEAIYMGRAYIAGRREDADRNGQFYGMALEGEMPIERLQALLNAEDLHLTLFAAEQRSASVPEDFRLGVHKLIDTLKSYERQIERFHRSVQNQPRDFQPEYIETFDRKVAQLLAGDLDEGLARLVLPEKVGANASVRQAAEEYFRMRFLPFLEKMELISRSFQPTQEYPLDYEWVNTALRAGFEGQDPFARIFNNVICSQYFANSYHFRARFFQTTLSALFNSRDNDPSECHVLLVYPGPAVEVQLSVLREPSRSLTKCNFDLLDLDERPLMYAQVQINRVLHEQKKKTSLRYLRMAFASTHTLPEYMQFIEKFDVDPNLETYDFISVPYLADVLDTGALRDLLLKLSQHLKPGGFILCSTLLPTHGGENLLFRSADSWCLMGDGRDLTPLTPMGMKCERILKPEEHTSFHIFSKPVQH